MDALFHWCTDNVLLCSIIGMAITFVLGANTGKIKAAGFTISQWVRKLFGEKVEKAIEDAVDALDEGLHSDNKKD